LGHRYPDICLTFCSKLFKKPLLCFLKDDGHSVSLLGALRAGRRHRPRLFCTALFWIGRPGGFQWRLDLSGPKPLSAIRKVNRGVQSQLQSYVIPGVLVKEKTSQSPINMRVAACYVRSRVATVYIVHLDLLLDQDLGLAAARCPRDPSPVTVPPPRSMCESPSPDA
jgi:hypothetical protein